MDSRLTGASRQPFDTASRGVLIGLKGTGLSAAEAELIKHPATAGVVLFTRNFESAPQLAGLIAECRKRSERPLLFAVDQEGGRVQRLREGFTRLPPLGALGGALAGGETMVIRALVEAHARVMALEMLALGIDMSLAPVLDIDGGCEVIGDRALHADPGIVAALGARYLRAMQDTGMSACGKHFPGHGCVAGDSHHVRPVDDRHRDTLWSRDLRPFRESIDQGIDSLMMSHVVYSQIDDRPAGYSERWIKQVLRSELGFAGVVMSDDLGMEGAASEPDIRARVAAGFDAGCNLMLACQPQDREEALEAAGRADPTPIVAYLAAQREPSAARNAADAARRTLSEGLARAGLMGR